MSVLVRPRDWAKPKWQWTITLYINRNIVLACHIDAPEGIVTAKKNSKSEEQKAKDAIERKRRQEEKLKRKAALAEARRQKAEAEGITIGEVIRLECITIESM
jgi:hypothetical protein